MPGSPALPPLGYRLPRPAIGIPPIIAPLSLKAAHGPRIAWSRPPGRPFHPTLDLPATAIIVSKGTRPDDAGYSEFEGTDTASPAFRNWGCGGSLSAGLATDYCVLNTALDALRLGYEVRLLTAGVRAVEVQPGDGARAIAAMRAAGAVALGG
jgi:nicotinamidase/pyrazinamidase